VTWLLKNLLNVLFPTGKLFQKIPVLGVPLYIPICFLTTLPFVLKHNLSNFLIVFGLLFSWAGSFRSSLGLALAAA
jgi:hypothetical protein